MSKRDKHYIYIVVREDLSLPQQVVQAGHAILEATLKFGHKIEEHPHFCILGASDRIDLINIMSTFLDLNIPIVHFQEEDIGHQLTAFATAPIHYKAAVRIELKKFPLLTSYRNNGQIREDSPASSGVAGQTGA